MTATMIGSTSSEGVFAQGAPLDAVARNASDAFSALMALRDKPDWVRDLCKNLDAFRALPKNWDSYGAAKPIPASIEVAKLLLHAIGVIVGIDRPSVGLSPAGNVALSWEYADGTRNLELEVLGTGMFRFAYLNEHNESANREGTTSNADEIASILTQW